MKKIILILIIFILTGCNYQEINNLEIATIININYKNNNYIMNIQTINPTNKDNINYKYYTSKDKTLTKTYNNILNQTSKQIYIKQLQIIILNENLVKTKLQDTITYLLENTEINKDIYIFQTKEENIINNLDNLNIPNQNIIDTLKNKNNNQSITPLTTLNEITKKTLNNQIELIIPTLITINKSLELSTPAIFKNNTFLNYLTEEETLCYNLITNNIKTKYLTINNKNNYYTIKLYNIKTNKKIKNNKVYIYIKGNANIIESNNIEEKYLNKKITQIITKNYNNINKKYNSDIFGIKELYYLNKKKYKRNNIKIISNIKIIEK